MPKYLGFTGDASRLRMGVRPLDLADWLEVDEHLEQDLAEKRRLLSERFEEVVGLAPDPDGAAYNSSLELLGEVAESVVNASPDTHRRVEDHVVVGETAVPVTRSTIDAAGVHPVVAAALLVQEDWCVHLPDASGTWRLAAASVSFPTRWLLSSKVGRTVSEIHGPIAHYDEQLANPVDRLFGRLQSGEGRWRLNWNLMDDPAMFQPTEALAGRASGPVAVDDVPTRIWLRIERQTMVRLRTSGAIVFGIRIHQDPLGSIAGSRQDMASLRDTLRSMTPEAWEYREMGRLGEPILGWLDRELARPAR